MVLASFPLVKKVTNGCSKHHYTLSGLLYGVKVYNLLFSSQPAMFLIFVVLKTFWVSVSNQQRELWFQEFQKLKENSNGILSIVNGMQLSWNIYEKICFWGELFCCKKLAKNSKWTECIFHKGVTPYIFH